MRVLGGEASLALQIFTKSTRTDRDVARENRHAFVEDVHVRDLVTDVHESNESTESIRMIDLECVVQCEGIDVDGRGLEPGIAEDAYLRLDELSLCGDEEHAHLEPFGIGVEDLEVQLHRLHVEGHMLLRFPSHQLARLLLFDAFDLDFFDDDIATTDGGHDMLRLDSGRGQRRLDRFGDDAGVHDLALDNGVGE